MSLQAVQPPPQEAIRAAAASLKNLLYLSAGEFVHDFETVIHPGVGSNCSDRTKERVRRFIMGPASVLSFLITGPAYALGCGLEELGVNKRSFCVWKGTLPALDRMPKTFLSFNICGQPSKIPEISGANASLKLRAKAIADLVREYNPDVVLFQELLYVTAASICEALKKDFATMAFGFGSTAIGLDSGLALFSKCKVNKIEFVPFTDQMRYVQLRGMVVADICGQKVFTAQLDVGTGSKGVQTRKGQFAEIKAEMDKDPRSIFLGDTNLDRTLAGQGFKEQIQDQFKNPTPFEKGAYTETWDVATWMTGAPPLSHPNEFIDFCLLPQNSPLEVDVKVVKAWENSDPKSALSDHFPLYAKIKDV